MAFITINHHVPADNGAAFVAENATLAGGVRLEKNSSVWYGAVLRADTGRIAIGENSNVQDNAVLHTGPGLDVTVGRGTSVGHGAVVIGVPGKVVRPVSAAQAAAIKANEEEYLELARAHAEAK